MSSVAAVILAAGDGTRFGRPKHSLRLGGATFLERAVATARSGGLSPIIAVVPPDIDPPPPAIGVVNERPADGLSRSLKLGLAAVPAGAAAAVILLVDQPTVSPALLSQLLEARGERPIVASRAGGVDSPPIVLERTAFALADELEGDEGLRRIVVTRPELVTPVELDALPPDVDTPSDLVALGQQDED